MHMGSFRVLGVPSEYFTILPIFLSMAPPAFFNKYYTVDAMHKMGSFPIPKEGRPVPAMDKITSQELEGEIIVNKTNPWNKYLGFLLDKIFSDFTVDLPSPDELEVLRSAILDVNPHLADSYPDAQKIPLYNTSTRQWNWPISPRPLPNLRRPRPHPQNTTLCRFSMRSGRLSHPRLGLNLPRDAGWEGIALVVCQGTSTVLGLTIASPISSSLRSQINWQTPSPG